MLGSFNVNLTNLTKFMHDLLPEKNLSLDGMPIVAQTEELDCKGLNLLLGQQSISLLLPVFLSKTGE